LTFTILVAFVGFAAAAASYFPTRKAVRIDPMVALRHD